MKKVFVVLAALLAFPAMAFAFSDGNPISNVVVNPDGISFTANIYETDANGNPLDGLGDFLQLPWPVVAPSEVGFVILMDSGSPTNPSDVANMSNWSDEYAIFNSEDQSGALQGYVHGFSDPADWYPFDTSSSLLLAAMLETGIGNDFTDFETYNFVGNKDGTSYTDTYNIYSDAPVGDSDVVPEPATMALFGLGLAGLAGKVLRKRTRT
jgi:hypothetical protein